MNFWPLLLVVPLSRLLSAEFSSSGAAAFNKKSRQPRPSPLLTEWMAFVSHVEQAMEGRKRKRGKVREGQGGSNCCSTDGWRSTFTVREMAVTCHITWFSGVRGIAMVTTGLARLTLHPTQRQNVLSDSGGSLEIKCRVSVTTWKKTTFETHTECRYTACSGKGWNNKVGKDFNLPHYTPMCTRRQKSKMRYPH